VENPASVAHRFRVPWPTADELAQVERFVGDVAPAVATLADAA
jgi:hypothetical protein